jgi:hypothetical protein
MIKPPLLLPILLVAALFFPAPLCAQDTDETRNLRLKFAYTGTLIAPGLRMGTEIPMVTVMKTRQRRSGISSMIEKQRMLDVGLGWYHHPDFHDNLYLTLGWTWRRISERGWFVEATPALGFSRTFNGGTTYRFENNEVSRGRAVGYNYLVADLGVGAGYDFSRVSGSPLAVYAKVHSLFMLPYNSFFLLKPLLQLGVIYTPAQFLSVKTKVISK